MHSDRKLRNNNLGDLLDEFYCSSNNLNKTTQKKMDFFFSPYNPIVQLDKCIFYDAEIPQNANDKPKYLRRLDEEPRTPQDQEVSMNPQWWRLTKLIMSRKEGSLDRVLHEYKTKGNLTYMNAMEQ